MDQKPWRAVINYARTAFLVGYFDSAKEAQDEAGRQACMRSEQPIAHLRVDSESGVRFRQYWRGRVAAGSWSEFC